MDGLIHLNERLFTSHDIAICDNGYAASDDTRIKSTRKCPKNLMQLKVVWYAWKRCISILRNAIERVFANLKQFQMLMQRINVNDIKFMYKVWVVACAHHNDFCQTFAPVENVHLQYLGVRLCELRTVQQNPCKEYYIVRPSSRRGKNKDQQASQSSFHDPQEDAKFDDGFGAVLRGKRNVIGELQNIEKYNWLYGLEFDVNDVDDIIGQLFQRGLARRYLLSMTDIVTFSVWKKDKYVLRFTNIKSKWCSGKYRKVILCFAHVKLLDLCATHQHPTLQPEQPIPAGMDRMLLLVGDRQLDQYDSQHETDDDYHEVNVIPPPLLEQSTQRRRPPPLENNHNRREEKDSSSDNDEEKEELKEDSEMKDTEESSAQHPIIQTKIKLKSWYDVDFDKIYNSRLSGLQ